MKMYFLFLFYLYKIVIAMTDKIMFFSVFCISTKPLSFKQSQITSAYFPDTSLKGTDEFLLDVAAYAEREQVVWINTQAQDLSYFISLQIHFETEYIYADLLDSRNSVNIKCQHFLDFYEQQTTGSQIHSKHE